MWDVGAMVVGDLGTLLGGWTGGSVGGGDAGGGVLGGVSILVSIASSASTTWSRPVPTRARPWAAASSTIAWVCSRSC